MIVEVVDGNCVVVSNRVSATGYEIKIGNIVTLDGLAAPRLGERGGVEAREGLSGMGSGEAGQRPRNA